MQLVLCKFLRVLVYLAFSISASIPLFAEVNQSAGTPCGSRDGTKNLPRFEIDTVKPVKQSNYSPIGLYVFPGGSIRIGQATLRMMIQYAYNVHDYQIMGAPSWSTQDLFEIKAIPPNNSSSSQYRPKYINNSPTEEQRLMLQSLLYERFGLRVCHEIKMVFGGYLTSAKKTSKLVVTKNKPAWPAFNPGGSTNGRGMSGEGVSMSYLASQLTRFLGFPVVDKTGLKGDYDFQLPNPSESDTPRNILQAQDSIKKSIYDSLPDLGLKLKGAKVPVDIIVIQEVKKPSSN